MSLHAFFDVEDRYALLEVGSSVGRGYGPRVVAREVATLESLRGKRVALPGPKTTATLVARNANVTIVLQFGNLSLSAQGRAVEEGARGDTIRVLNTTSNRQLEGVVVGPDTVAVSIGPRVAALMPQ